MLKYLKFSATLITSILLILPSFAVNANENDMKLTTIQEVKKIEIETAQTATENFILMKSQLTGFEKGQISLKEKLYDVDEAVIAYYFEVKLDDKIAYFITSAIGTMDPILQYGIGSGFPESVNEKGEADKIYYFGSGNFQYGTNGKEVLEKFEKAKANTILLAKQDSNVSMIDIEELEKAELNSINRGTENSPGWENLLEKEPIREENTTFATKKTLPVDRIYQRSSGINNPKSACGATTATMIMDYYYDELRYNVRDNEYYGSWAKLVNHLYNEMGSTFLGTPLAVWKTGALTHVRHDSSGWEADIYKDAVGKSSKFIAAIDSKDPVGVRFDRFDAGGSDIEYHFVAGIGYDKNGSYDGDLHIAYLDPDNGANNEGIHWLDWTADDDDFGFAYLK